MEPEPPRDARLWSLFQFFFFNEDALTFRGLTNLAAGLLGVLGVCLALNMFSKPPSIDVDNVAPIATLHLEQLLEQYEIEGQDPPPMLVDALRPFDAHYDGERAIQFSLARPASFTMDLTSPNPRIVPDVVANRILTWFVFPTRFVEDGSGARSDDPLSIAEPSVGQPDKRIEIIKRRLMLKSLPEPVVRPVATDAPSVLSRLKDYEFDGKKLDLHETLHSPDNRSRYHSPESWLATNLMLEVDPRDVFDALDEAGITALERAVAYTYVANSFWVINILQVTNTSREAAVSKARLAISRLRRTPIELLGGDITVNTFGDSYVGTVDDLLPGESRWLIARTRWAALSKNDVAVFTDRAPVLDSAAVQRALPWVGIIGLVYLIANVVAVWRFRARRVAQRGP